MKIAVTGGTGFVGSAVVKNLTALNEKILILSRRESQSYNPNISVLKTDYHNMENLTDNLKGCDALIHLAAALFCRSSREYFKANAVTAKNLRIAAQKTGIKKIVYVSSLAAGGPMPLDAQDRTESINDNPISAYGKSKLAAEKELLEFSGDLVVLRPPIVYGPKDAGFSKIAQWVKKGIMVVPGSDRTPFSFIYLKDLAKCVQTALYSDFPKGEKYYVCENKTYQWGEFIEEMALQMKVKKPKMIKMPPSALYAAGFAYEVISYITKTEPVLNRDKAREAAGGKWTCSSSKWEKASGFSSWTPLREGLKETFSEAK
ncbi:MAG: NAD-dependent epimerase/dehydratase family protein [Elusimicrobiota bacterium]